MKVHAGNYLIQVYSRNYWYDFMCQGPGRIETLYFGFHRSSLIFIDLHKRYVQMYEATIM